MASTMFGKSPVPVIVLDGGVGSELCKRGLILPDDKLWSASVLNSNVSALVEVHRDFISSGADVIVTCSYQANVDNLQKHLHIGPTKAEKLIARSCEAAMKAREECDTPGVRVAGSVGSYGAALSDFSEYSGAYADVMSVEEFIDWHRPRVRCLVAAGCDLLAFETIPAAREAMALVRLLREFPGTKAWLSFTTSRDSPECTAKGEPLAVAMRDCQRADSSGQICAVGVNCCPPDSVQAIFEKTGPLPVPFVAYPNSGEVFSSKSGWGPGPQPRKPLAGYVADWMTLNVALIGGCCRTGPEDIRGIAEVVKRGAAPNF
ncbi:homocysteine S-methyltransferase YbgG-like [Haemaphysalis longicornis]